MPPRINALLCAVLPFVAVHLAYLSNMSAGTVPVCVPYIEGCLSISRAARSGEVLFIFRALMMPTVALLVCYWLHSFIFLELLHRKTTKGMHAMRVLGILGSLFLILYVTFLGTEGDFYRWMRRYGIIFYFSFTALAQIFFIQSLFQYLPSGNIENLRNLLKIKLVLCILQWSIGLISVPLGVLIDDKTSRDIMHNVIEWNYALAMNTFFFVTYLIFKTIKFDQSYYLKKKQ